MTTRTLAVVALLSCGAVACAGRQPEPPVSGAPAPVAREVVEPAAAQLPISVAPAQPPPVPQVAGPLVLDGTPEIPDELRLRMNQYLNTRGAGVASLSDDGSRLLVSTRFGETTQLHELTKPLGARKQLTFADEPLGSASYVPGNPNALLFLQDAGGNEQHQLFRLDRTTGKTSMVSDGKGRVTNYLWSHSGRQVAYNGTGRNLSDYDIYVGDGESPGRLLVERTGAWAPLAWSRDDRKLLLQQYLSINDTRLHVVDVATGEVVRVSPEQPAARYSVAAFGKDSNTLYVATDREGEFVELYEVNLAKNNWRPLTRDIAYNVSELALSPDARTLMFTVNIGGFTWIYSLDTRTRKTRPAPRPNEGVISGLRFARKAPVLAYTYMSPVNEADAYSYDLRSKKVTRWTESELGGLNPKSFVSPSLIGFKSFDGREIPSFYYRPQGEGPFPVVIMIHGGPEGQTRATFSALTQFLVVERGYAVLRPNVRGSDGYGKSYLRLDNGFLREDSVKDIGALLDWVAAQPELDAKRVAVQGGSYGGYMVLASLVHFSDRIVAGVDNVGISNFVTFLENTSDYRRDLRRAEYGDERDPKMREHLMAISPLTQVGKIHSALFVAQGANDPRVPASEAEQIVRAVRAAGQDVWFMLAMNEGHGFRKKENRNTYYLLMVLFFDQHLGAGSQ